MFKSLNLAIVFFNVFFYLSSCKNQTSLELQSQSEQVAQAKQENQVAVSEPDENVLSKKEEVFGVDENSLPEQEDLLFVTQIEEENALLQDNKYKSCYESCFDSNLCGVRYEGVNVLFVPEHEKDNLLRCEKACKEDCKEDYIYGNENLYFGRTGLKVQCYCMVTGIIRSKFVPITASGKIYLDAENLAKQNCLQMATVTKFLGRCKLIN